MSKRIRQKIGTILIGRISVRRQHYTSKYPLLLSASEIY